MRLARMLPTLTLLVTFFGISHAQTGCSRLSWGTCDPWVLNSDFIGPGQYKLVESVYGMGASNVGTETEIHITDFTNPFGIPDAWRFEDAGCQVGRLLLSNNALAKSCPAMKGANPQTNAHYGIEANGSAVLRLAISYDAFTPVASTRYTVWQIVFDHSSSTIGPTPSDRSTCGGAERCVFFSLVFVKLFTTTGQGILLPECDGGYYSCTHATWNIGPASPGTCVIDWPDPGFDCYPVPTRVGTWGRVRATYH